MKYRSLFKKQLYYSILNIFINKIKKIKHNFSFLNYYLFIFLIILGNNILFKISFKKQTLLFIQTFKINFLILLHFNKYLYN